jgi:hypothetical protein
MAVKKYCPIVYHMSLILVLEIVTVPNFMPSLIRKTYILLKNNLNNVNCESQVISVV